MHKPYIHKGVNFTSQADLYLINSSSQKKCQRRNKIENKDILELLPRIAFGSIKRGSTSQTGSAHENQCQMYIKFKAILLVADSKESNSDFIDTHLT